MSTDVGFWIGVWVGFVLACLVIGLIFEFLPEAKPATALRPQVGICGASCPSLTSSSPVLTCTLPAGHLGWHRNREVGTDWSVAPVPPAPGVAL